MTKYLTTQGLEKLKKELECLKTVKRREIAERLERCISYGDLTENSEYQEAKEVQGSLEDRILELENIIKNAVILPKEKRRGWVQMGSTVLVSTGWKKEKFQIVVSEEADPLQGKISDTSPLGKAFLNKPEGARVIVQTPNGSQQYKILKIL